MGQKPGWGHAHLLPMVRMRIGTKDILYKRTALAQHAREVGTKGTGVDIASPSFTAGPKSEPGQFDLKAVQTLHPLKCRFIDTETNSTITGPGGAKLTVVMS